MPIYEYVCSSCSHELEALQKFSDPALTQCPSCGTDKLTKKISAAGFQLKGSGWYATDFKGNGSKPAAKDKAEGTKPDGTKPDGAKPESTESKSDKSESKSDAAPACGAGACAACS